jgi:hypothetical protein
MADPLWTRDSNERLAEHFARHVMYEIHADIFHAFVAVAQGLYWTVAPSRANALPQGFYNSVRNIKRSRFMYRPVPGRPGDSTWTTYEWEAPQPYWYGGYSFAPDTVGFRRPIESTADHWAVHWDRGHETMITRETWHNLEHQTAVFRRGNQLLLVAAAPLPEPLLAQDVQPALALGRVDDISTHVAPAVIDEHGAFRARAVVDSGGYLASIEVIGTEDVGRARYGAPPQPLLDGFGLSDLALLVPRFEEEGLALEDALFPAATAPRDEPVGVYFEVYGASPDETLDVTLEAEKLNPSFFQRITRSLGLSSKTPFRLAWQEPVEVEDGIAKRFIVIDGGALSGGEHELTVTVRRADGAIATVSRLARLR